MPSWPDAPTRLERTLSGLGGDAPRPRRALDARLDVLPLDGRHARFWCKAEQLSHQGVFLPTRRSLPLGTLVVVKLYLGGRSPLWRLTAEVVHHIGGVGLGCRFLDVSPEVGAVIGKLVAWSAAAPMPLRTMDPHGRPGRAERVPSRRWLEAPTAPWRRRR